MTAMSLLLMVVIRPRGLLWRQIKDGLLHRQLDWLGSFATTVMLLARIGGRWGSCCSNHAHARGSCQLLLLRGDNTHSRGGCHAVGMVVRIGASTTTLSGPAHQQMLLLLLVLAVARHNSWTSATRRW